MSNHYNRIPLQYSQGRPLTILVYFGVIVDYNYNFGCTNYKINLIFIGLILLREYVNVLLRLYFE